MSTQTKIVPKWMHDAAAMAATSIGRITVAAPDQNFASYEEYWKQLCERSLLAISSYAPITEPADVMALRKRLLLAETTVTACHSAMLGKVNPKHPAWGCVYAVQDAARNADSQKQP